jgi:hypothetical protein
MAYTQLKPRHTTNARVEEISRESSHYRLSIPSGKADRYRLSQLDDYAKTRRKDFPLRYPITLDLSARASSESIPGTWGFGLWNDPFGLSLGFGGNPFRLPALPNAVWFFGASEESYLSFKESPRPERSGAQTKGEPQTNPSVQSSSTDANHASSTGFAENTQPSAQRDAYNGFIAQTFRSPTFHPLLIPAGLAFPFSRTRARRLLGKVIADEGTRLSVDVTQWHRYRIDWRENRVSFAVDDALVFESSLSPHPPLGLVIWIDNQFAAFTPEGQVGFGVLENPEPVWLEVKDIEVK